MIDHNFLEKLRQLYATSMSPVELDNDGRRFFLRNAAGDPLEFEFPAPARSVETKTLDSFIGAVADPAICKDPEVHVGARVRAWCDRARRDGQVTLDLPRTKTLQAMLLLSNCGASGKSFSVREAYDFIRFAIGAASVQPATLAMLRRIDFEKKTATFAGAAHGADTLGKSIEAGVVQQLPEQVPVMVTPFLLPETEQFVTPLYIAVDAENEQIILRADGDDITRNVLASCTALAGRLHTALPGVKVYVGEAG